MTKPRGCDAEDFRDLLAARDPRIRLISRENRGPTRSLNEGIETATDEYVAIVNADDVSLPDRLVRQAALARRTFPISNSK